MKKDIVFKIRDILKNAGIDENEAKAEASLIVQSVSNMTIEEIVAGKEISNTDKILEIANKRAQTKAPIQHLLEEAYFMGEKFLVNKNVLIPRDETQILVECAISTILKIRKERPNTKINILDIGSGSGCISSMISKILYADSDIEIMGVDISTDALKVSIENMQKLGHQGRVVYRKSDIYSGLREIDKFDVIVSNPPYIPISQYGSLQKEVQDYEPKGALFAKDEYGVDFYEKIIKDAYKYLKPQGYVMFELGINQANIVKGIFAEYGYEIYECKKDLSNIDRVLAGQLL